jgi:hypothetical protein
MRVMLRICAVVAGAAGLLQPAAAQAQTYQGKVGVGISLGERGIGTFTDTAKESWRFQTLDGARELVAAEIDARGWPAVDCQKVVMDERPFPEWIGVIDDPEAYRVDVSGTYKCVLTGQATVGIGNLSTSGTAVQNFAYDSVNNLTTFDLIVPGPPGPNHGVVVLNFVNTRRTPASAVGSGFTDLQIMKPGYTTASAAVLHQAFLSCAASAKFAAMRFMDFTGTNYQETNIAYPSVREWATRKLPTDSSQTAFPGKDGGAAWEHVIDIANATGIDPWINVPVSASADYIAQLATLLKNGLNPTLNIYVESSNEVWNTIFPQRNYNAAEASALGLTEYLNHARRTVQIAQIFASVFGQSAMNSRVRVVLANHAPMLQWWVQPMLDYISTNFGAPKNYIYMLARQGYFAPAAVGATDSVATILANARAGIDSQTAPDPTNNANRQQWIAKAASYGLAGGCGFYEGGPSFPSGGDTTNLANQITANRDPQMGDLLKYDFGTQWLDLGGGLAMQFTLTSGYFRYGCWGLTDDVTKPDRNSKFAAIRSMLAPTTPPATPPAAPTNLTATAVSSQQINLAWTDNATDETGFQVERATRASGPWAVWAVIAQTGANTTTYSDSGLARRTTYFYRVAAVNAAGASGYSNTASARTSRR